MSRYPKETEEWFATLEFCQVCWTPRHVVERQPGGFQHMHIVPRSRRRYDGRENILGGCWRCHETQTGMRNGFPKLTVGMLLGVKFESDPEFYDPDMLEGLWCRGRLPWPWPLPAEYWEERLRHQPLGNVRIGV